MRVFVEVARAGGFAAGARRLGISTSSASRQVVNLEDHFGRQLFVRTTRHLRLTQDGEEMLEACRQIVDDYDAMVQDRACEDGLARGDLKITMPHFVVSVLAWEFLPEFARNHPHVTLNLTVTDKVTNLVSDGFDMAVRVGQLPDSALMARKMMDLRLALVCSDDYAARCGVPETPHDLVDHNCLIDTVAPYRDRWPLLVDGVVEKIAVNGSIRLNSGTGARDLAMGGAGIALLPELLVMLQVQRGHLRTVLDQHVPVGGGIYAIYQRARYPTAAQRVFTEALSAYARRHAHGRPRLLQSA